MKNFNHGFMIIEVNKFAEHVIMTDAQNEPSLQEQLIFCLQKTLDPLTPHAQRAGFYQVRLSGL